MASSIDTKGYIKTLIYNNSLTNEAAFKEIIQNSHDANCEEIKIYKTDFLNKTFLTFEDDGIGMDFNQFIGYLTLNKIKESTTKCLGRFGFGKTSFFTLLKNEDNCDCIFIITKSSNDKKYGCMISAKYINKNGWENNIKIHEEDDIMIPGSLKKLMNKEKIENNGTKIFIECNTDKFTEKKIYNTKEKGGTKISIKDYLRTIFKQHIPIKINFFGEYLKCYDPLFINNKKTDKRVKYYKYNTKTKDLEELKKKNYKEEHNYLKLTFVYLGYIWDCVKNEEPEIIRMSDYGRRGVYLYRNNSLVNRIPHNDILLQRLEEEGKFLNMRTHRKMRCSIEYFVTNTYEKSIDKLFNISVNKSSCDLLDKITSRFKKYSKSVRNSFIKKYGDKGTHRKDTRNLITFELEEQIQKQEPKVKVKVEEPKVKVKVEEPKVKVEEPKVKEKTKQLKRKGQSKSSQRASVYDQGHRCPLSKMDFSKSIYLKDIDHKDGNRNNDKDGNFHHLHPLVHILKTRSNKLYERFSTKGEEWRFVHELAKDVFTSTYWDPNIKNQMQILMNENFDKYIKEN